ncbi:MAG: hypothetical protein J0M20_03630 [Burkholderiales bacterium]|nr:hypothetical protein [Burkholderiales bacterium]
MADNRAMPPATPDQPAPAVDKFQPTNRRQRLKIIALTVAVVVALWSLLLLRPGAHPRSIPGVTPEPCKPGQTQACIGGQANVTLLPAASAASR